SRPRHPSWGQPESGTPPLRAHRAGAPGPPGPPDPWARAAARVAASGPAPGRRTPQQPGRRAAPRLLAVPRSSSLMFGNEPPVRFGAVPACDNLSRGDLDPVDLRPKWWYPPLTSYKCLVKVKIG